MHCIIFILFITFAFCVSKFVPINMQEQLFLLFEQMENYK